MSSPESHEGLSIRGWGGDRAAPSKDKDSAGQLPLSTLPRPALLPPCHGSTQARVRGTVSTCSEVVRHINELGIVIILTAGYEQKVKDRNNEQNSHFPFSVASEL